MSRRKKEDAKENQGIDVKEQKGNPSRRKKTRMQEEKRKDVKDKLWKDVEAKKKNVKDKLWKDVKDKLWKDVEEKKKNFFNIFFFGEHITKSKNIDEYGNKSARIYTLCKAALA